MKLKLNGNILVLVAVLLWSLVGLMIKSVDAAPIWIMIIRSLSAGLFLSPYIFKEKIYPMKKVALAGFFMAVFLLCVTITTQIANSAMAVAMQYTAPMYIIAYGFYINKRVDRNKMIVLLSISIGIVFIVINSLQNSNPFAIFTGILIGLAFVFYSYSLQGVTEGNPLGIVALVNLISFAFYVVVLLIKPASPPTNIGDIIIMTLSGVFISGISYAFYGAGLRLISIDRAMMICLLEPILNPIWVFLFRGEAPTIITIIGVGFIMLGATYDIITSKNSVKQIE